MGNEVQDSLGVLILSVFHHFVEELQGQICASNRADEMFEFSINRSR